MKKLITKIDLIKKPNKLYCVSNATEERAKEFNIPYNKNECYVIEVDIAGRSKNE